MANREILRRRGQVVRQRFAKPPFTGSNPVGASNLLRAGTLGALAGLALALADYGALWLWLPTWPLRAEVLVRMVAFQASAGALLGLTLHLVGHLRATERTQSWLRWTYLAIPFAAVLVWASLQGGTASRLPHRPWIAAGATAACVGAIGLSLRWGGRLLERARESTRISSLLMVATLIAFSVTTKIDQHVFPKLYEPLHGALTLGAWALAGYGIRLFEARWGLRRTYAVAPRGAFILLVALIASILTLPSRPNARVALHDSRAASTHSLMLAIGPLLRFTEPREEIDAAIARARERARSRATIVDGLAQLPDAHVLVISIDALRADHLGAYGYARPISTYLDRFAEEALVFEHAYAAAPHSSYSISSLWTSAYIHQRVELGLPLPERTVASVLGDVGYRTAAFYTQGIFHTEGERMRVYEQNAFRFDRHEHANLTAENMTDAALEEIDRIHQDGEPPSLTWVHYFDVHEPYREQSLGTADLDRYDGEIRNVDRAIERLITGVRRRLERPVIIALTADHGEEFRDHGGVYHGSTLYEEQIRVPLILHVPGVEGRRVAAPVELVDLAPTLLGLVDHADPTMRGDDLRPLFGEDLSWPPAFGAVSYKKMVVRWPYKLVADLRFDLFEIYDLEEDPHERVNLAGERPELLADLKGEVYAWLDELRSSSDPHQAALALGRMRDRRALDPLCELLADDGAATEDRVEAAQLLARLAAVASNDTIFEVMTNDPNPLIRAEAAVALGRQFDDRAREPLLGLVRTEDPDLRTRAAVSLGRLRDVQAVPALIDALHVSKERYERQEAVRWLGRLQDPSALEPLVELLPEFRVRHLTVIALGHLGDPRAYGPLAQTLQWEHHRHVRDAVARALGQLGDPRAINLVLPLAQSEPDLKYPPEALVRLGALREGRIGGIDFDRQGPGLSECQQGPERHDWDYLNRTSCRTRRARVQLRLRRPDDAGRSVVAILRARRVDSQRAAEVSVELDGHSQPLGVDGEWTAHRWEVERAPRRATIEMPEGVVLELDHLLIVPAKDERTARLDVEARDG